MRNQEKMGALVDIFTTGKKVFEANKGYDFSHFAQEPTQDEITEMLRFDNYADYLKSRVPTYVSSVMIIAKLIQQGGYKGAICTSFKEANLIPTNGDPIAIDAAIRKGVELLKQTLKTDVKSLDSSKDHQVMVEVTGVRSENIEQVCKSNKVVVESIGARDLRATLNVGNIVPLTQLEMKSAQTILLSADHKVPIYAQKFEKVGDRIQAGPRILIPLECNKLEKLGFDYYKLASSKIKVIANTKSAGFKNYDNWNSKTALETYVRDKESGGRSPGKEYLLSTSWLDGKVDAKTKLFLSHCRLKYVGKSTGLWNWVAVMQDGPVYGEDEVMMLVRVIPKIFKLCLLLGVRRIPWTHDAIHFLQLVLSSFGMMKKYEVIADVMGHLLHPQLCEVNSRLKELPGVTKEVFDMWFSSDEDYNPQVIKFDEVGDLGNLFGSDKQKPDEQLNAKVEVVQKKEDAKVEVVKSNLEHVNEQSQVNDNHVNEQDDDDDAAIKDLESIAFYEDTVDFVFDDDIADNLRHYEWNVRSLHYFFNNICVLTGDDESYLREDVSTIVIDKLHVTVIFTDGSQNPYTYGGYYALSKRYCRIWTKDKGFVFELFEPPPRSSSGRGRGRANTNERGNHQPERSDVVVEDKGKEKQKGGGKYIKPIVKDAGVSSSNVDPKSNLMVKNDLGGASDFFD